MSSLLWPLLYAVFIIVPVGTMIYLLIQQQIGRRPTKDPGRVSETNRRGHGGNSRHHKPPRPTL
jgi:hypothetical protein